MAVWQFTVSLIPENWVIATSYDVNKLYDEDGYNTDVAWVDNQPTYDINTLIDKFFPKAKSWHEDLICWGDEESTDVNLWKEKSKIDGLRIRLDLQEPVEKVIENIIDLAEQLSCLIFIPERKEIIDRNKDLLMTYAMDSNAARYVRDPHAYLDSLAKQ